MIHMPTPNNDPSAIAHELIHANGMLADIEKIVRAMLGMIDVDPSDIFDENFYTRLAAQISKAHVEVFTLDELQWMLDRQTSPIGRAVSSKKPQLQAAVEARTAALCAELGR